VSPSHAAPSRAERTLSTSGVVQDARPWRDAAIALAVTRDRSEASGAFVALLRRCDPAGRRFDALLRLAQPVRERVDRRVGR
jgi:hypothetical protein